MALMTGDSLYWKTRIDNTGLRTGAVQAKGILRGLTRSITGMDVFAGLGIAAGIVFAKMTKEVYNFSKNFETAMKEVQTISRAVQNDFEGISQEIIDMSKTVPDTAQKLTKALYQIVSAGYDGARAMEILRVSTELAVATVTDTFTAADALTYVMNAYGEAAGTASQISDKLFTIVKLGKVKMEELGPSISMVTGLAAEAGMKFNDLAAFFAEAVKKIQPHIVSTGIRGFVTALLRAEKEGSQAADAARKLGIEFDMTTLKSKGLWYMLDQMSNATKENKAALMELFPNVRGLIGLLAIMTDEGANYSKTLKEIENSLGNTGKAFKIMMETTESQFAILKNNIMAKLKPLGDSLLGFMNSVATGINRAISGTNDELSNLARTYSELIDVLQKKKNRIDDLIETIENLRDKTELTEEETIELKAAEEALAAFYPTLGKVVEGVAGKIDVLTLAKIATKELSLEIMDLEVEQAQIAKDLAILEKTIYEEGRDEGNKEINRIKGQMIIIKELTEFELAGMDKRRGKAQEEIYTKEKLAEMVDASLKKNIEYLKLEKQGSIATEKRRLEEAQLNATIKETTLRLKIKEEARKNLGRTEAKLTEQEIQNQLDLLDITKKRYETGEIELNDYRKLLEKALIEFKKYPDITKKIEIHLEALPKIVIPVRVEDVKENLDYMADQYKSYWKIVAQEGEAYVEKYDAQLAKDAKNYGNYLDEMLERYKENAELTKEIMLDIAEYNKEITDKRKKVEEELFELLADDREKDLAKAKEGYDNLTEEFKEGTAERLDIEEQYREKKEAINEKYDIKEAEAKLAIFKEGWEKQIGEEKEAYVRRLEAKLKELEAEKVIDIKRVEFIRDRLNIIRILEKEESDKKKAILESFLGAYKTMEEKIAAINAETAKALKATTDKATKNRIKNIEKQRIAAVKFADARQEIDSKIAEYGENLNNEQLGSLIKVLEEMKIKYKEFPDLVIYLNEKIAESQKETWENLRDEIGKTVDNLHALADVVGIFDTELEEMINNVANIVGGIGEITIGISTGGIAGILSGIFIIIQSIFSIFSSYKSKIKELNEELRKITLELQKQQNILSQALGTERLKAIQDTIDLLEDQIDVYNEMIAAEEERWRTDQEKIDEWLSSIESANAEITNLWRQYQEILTGVTATSIADAIADGFTQGLDSAEVFADTFNDMMKKAIIDAFKRTIITKFIEDWYEQFAEAAEEGLTAEEIADLAKTYLEMIENAGEEWEAFADILEAAGIDLSDMFEGADITGLTGAIAGITEETAGLLAGQFQAIRINTVDILTNMEDIIIINARIADNTEYNKYLKDINDKLSEGRSSEIESLRGIGGV